VRSPASILIPTRARPDYLQVALASIAPQAARAGAEVLVIDDAGDTPAIRALAERLGARYEPHPGPLGLNVARNTGLERSTSELLVFVDDDVEVAPGWLEALLRAAREHPEIEVFTGPVRPRLEGPAPRSCGREGPPITSLDLGERDTRNVRFAWGANMAIRRSALERIGPFDTTLADGGDEQEWQERLRREGQGQREAPGEGSDAGRGQGRDRGPVLYVAQAALDHRRAGPDARLRSLSRAAHARGRAARRFDARRGQAPSLARELRTLAGCLGHVVRRRCPAGLTMVAHSAGRLREGLREAAPHGRGGHAATTPSAPHAAPAAPHAGSADPRAIPTDDFLSGESGTVGGLDGVRRGAEDVLLDAREIASGRRLRLARAARHEPPRRRVLVLGVERPEHRRLAAAAHTELERSRHEVRLRFGLPGGLGKFENLNRLLDGLDMAEYDWLLVLDDDLALPRGFLDRFLLLAERFSLDLAQPAHRLRSHAAWRITRRRPGLLAHETRFVEIGPVTAFARRTLPTLLPFPPLAMGWGLDLHWAALARERGWRCGVIDAVPIRHIAAPAASAYSREAALAEARAFLSERPHLSAREAQVTLATHRRLQP
jgi:glycosyltransferase involved in cell wall biosynthesis